jgi:hypothetical protein
MRFAMKNRVVRVMLAVWIAAACVPPPIAAQEGRSTEVSLSRGIEAFKRGDFETARRHFDAALARDPQFAAAHYFRGLSLLQLASEATTLQDRDRLLEWAQGAFEQSRLLDPELVAAYLDGGIAQVILGQFEQAESSFQRFLESRPDDPMPYLFLAVAHYRQGRDDPAHLPRAEENLTRAEEALARSGRENRRLQAYIELYRGLIYIQQRKRDAAEKALSRCGELDPEIARQAKELLERVQRGELGGRRPWDLSLQLGWDWDSNVVLRGRRIRGLRGDDDDEDWRFGLSSAFTYRFVDTDEWVVGAGGSIFESWHTDIDRFNVQTYGLNVYAGYSPSGAPWLSFGLRYDWDHSLLDNDTFLVRHRITPQVDVREADWTKTTLFYQLDARDYGYYVRDERLDRDGHIHAFGVIQDFELFELFERAVTTSLSYRYEDVSTDGREFDGDNHIFAFGLGVPLPEDFSFDFASEWEAQHYDHRALFDADRSRRRDLIHTLLFALTKRFNEHLSARFQVEITKDDSNVIDRRGREPFSYDRVIYGLSVLYQF